MSDNNLPCYVGYKYIGLRIEGKSTALFPREVAEKIVVEANLALAGLATHWLIPQEAPVKKERNDETKR